MPNIIVIAFTDIVDSTAAKRAIGDAAYLAVAHQHNSLIRSIAGSSELKTIGDSFMLRFHDPVEAVAKLVEIQTRLEASPILLGSEPLLVRSGMHIGDAILWPSPKGDEDYLGTMVDQAARYESLARGGQIIISADLHSRVKDRFDDLPGIRYHAWGPYYLKGVGWNNVFEVLWGDRLPIPPSGKPQFKARRFLTPFIGRKAELEKIESLLRQKEFPLITLKGLGGVGKTRLADEIEHRAAQLFHDGTFFVELESVPNSVADIEDQIRSACGIETGSTEQFFSQKSSLLILNNCETVPLVSEIVSRLLKHCGGLRVLATSQLPLNVYGEQIWPVDSMAPADAESLFLERARRSHPAFSLSAQDRPNLDRIFESTDRIAFCIELAAAKVRPGRSLASIASGIEQKLSSLAGPMERARHSSVTACIDWSFGLLPDAEKTLFPKLSIFRGGFLPKDVAAVCETPDAESLLYSLLDASLLRLHDDRFSLRPIAAEYGHTLLGDEVRPLLIRHAYHYLDLAKNAASLVKNHCHSEGLALFRSEFENMRAGMLLAVETESDEAILQFGFAFAGNLSSILKAQAEVDALEWTLAAAKRSGNQNDQLGAHINLAGALVRLPTGNRQQNLKRAIESLSTAMSFPMVPFDPTALATIQLNLGSAYSEFTSGSRDDNLRLAIESYECALRLWTQLGLVQKQARAQNQLGLAYLDLPSGNREQNLYAAISYFKAALSVQTPEESPVSWAATQNNLGLAYLELKSPGADNIPRAIDCFEAALRVRTAADFPAEWATTLSNLGLAYRKLQTGDRRENLLKSVQLFEDTLRVRTEQHLPYDWAATQTNLGGAYLELLDFRDATDLHRAIVCFQSALRVQTEKDFPLDWAGIQNNLGVAYGKLPPDDSEENPKRAIAHFEAALRVWTEHEFPEEWARAQKSLADLFRALRTGDREHHLLCAISHYEAALRVRTESANPRAYAAAHWALADVLYDLPSGDRAENLRRAFLSYENVSRALHALNLPDAPAAQFDAYVAERKAALPSN